MAFFDRDEQRLVVRVVYDGPANAGKTTNLQQLCQYFTKRRRSDLVSYGDVAGRTLFFEWLHLDGGLVGGFPLRCQLVTVPGQAVLDHRRKPILAQADAVVFVCESQLSSIEMSRRMLDDLAHPSGAGFVVPIVLQANKQDLPGALPPAEILTRLSLPPTTPIVGTRAAGGSGVRETVVLAIRAAANRVQRTLLEGGVDGLPAVAEGHEDLYRRLQLTPEPTTDSTTALALSRLPNADPAMTSAPRPAEVVEYKTEAPLPNTAPREGEPQRDFPAPSVPMGHVWPAALGREILREVALETPTPRPELVGRHGMAEGSGTTDCHIFQAGSWCLKTSNRRRFDDPEAARTAMLNLARRKTALRDLLVPRTVLCLRESRGALWLWTITPWLTTLRGWMSTAVAERDEPSLELALTAYGDAVVESLGLAARARLVLDVHPSNFALYNGRIAYIDDDIAAGGATPAAGHAILRRADEYSEFPSAVDAYIRSVEAAILVKLSAEEIRNLAVVDSLAEVTARTEAGRAAKDRLLRALSGRAVPWMPLGG